MKSRVPLTHFHQLILQNLEQVSKVVILNFFGPLLYHAHGIFRGFVQDLRHIQVSTHMISSDVMR